MTSRRKCAVAWLLELFFVLVVPLLIMVTHLPVGLAAISAVISSVVFAFWALTFSCPRCGTALLWGIRGHWKIARPFPRRTCKVCGLPTDKPFVSK